MTGRLTVLNGLRQAVVSQSCQWPQHIVRHRTSDLDTFFGYRMVKSEFSGMQHQPNGVRISPKKTILPAVTVGRVTNHRVIDPVQVSANLMEPTGSG